MHKRSLVLITLIAILLLIPLGMYFVMFHGSLARNHARWGEFGSYASGIYGTFAFLILAYTTHITRKQFKIQNEDNVFFKLFDSFQNRIINSSVVIDDVEYSGHQMLKALVRSFYDELWNESINLARELLSRSPETIADVHYMKIFQAIWGGSFVMQSFPKYKADFIADITSSADPNDRWERLKHYIDSRGYESQALREALGATGSVNFYQISFLERQGFVA